MTRVYYMVGRNGYETRCNTYGSALKQAAADRNYRIRLCYEEVEEKKPTLSPMRKAMIEQFGYVSPKFKDRVVLN